MTQTTLMHNYCINLTMVRYMVLASAIELFSRQARIKVILLNERTDGRFTDEPKHRFIALTLSVEDGQEARIFF